MSVVAVSLKKKTRRSDRARGIQRDSKNQDSAARALSQFCCHSSRATGSSYSFSTNPLFFFFQAEDGIRDADVTGVQTCALPIFGRSESDVVFTRYSPLSRNA